MNLFSRFLSGQARQSEKRDSLEVQGVGLNNLSAIWSFLDGGNRANASNEIVSDATATSLATVYTCIRVLSDAIASLPLVVYRQTPTGKQIDTNNHLLHLLSVEPNPEVSAFTFFETGMAHLLLRGNFYAEIQRDTAGNVVGLWNLDPRLTQPVRVALNGALAYRTSDGEQPGQNRIVEAANMLHVLQFSWDGICGQSPIAMLRETVGLALSQQKFTARMMVNSGVPALALKQKGTMSPEGKVAARADFERMQTGASVGRIAILDNGYELEKLGMSGEDTQLLQSRAFSRAEIAAAFRVPPSMCGDMTRLSNSNHEQQSLSFVVDSLSPILKRIEVEFKRKLLPPATNGRPNLTLIQFDLRERLRGDFQSTMAGFATGRQNGFYSANDVRRELGEDTIGPAGDTYVVQVNLQNQERLLDTESVQDQPIASLRTLPDDISRSTIAASSNQYLRMYRDAIGRLAARSVAQRDLGTTRQIFEPLLLSIADVGADHARRSTNASEWQHEPAKAITDYLLKLSERSAHWKPEDLDSITASELQKATKTLSLAAHRSIAECAAMKGLVDA